VSGGYDTPLGVGCGCKQATSEFGVQLAKENKTNKTKVRKGKKQKKNFAIVVSKPKERDPACCAFRGLRR
jgi:hypothetical protein